MNERSATARSQVESVDFACTLLERVRTLLDGGRRWQSVGLAATSSGMPCEPTSSAAHYFSLKGAAYRASSEILLDSQHQATGTICVDDILQALTTSDSAQRWVDAEFRLLGVRHALGEYRAMFEERRQRNRG